ncbi:DUF3262 family protein [Uliginosibacterium gangwonense]|uniref:DUF3262 family protein n=1 Tax=Uliginosibacterium gangwonense TaxID=392736 RepID=UPI00037E5315|nr:DUF3262 family protein [Uliginosibacterium gangwonense]
MNSTQVNAFKNAAGGPNGGYEPSDISVVIVGMVATIVLLWAGDSIRRLGADAQQANPDEGPKAFKRAMFYAVRVLVLVALVIYLIH